MSDEFYIVTIRLRTNVDFDAVYNKIKMELYIFVG